MKKPIRRNRAAREAAKAKEQAQALVGLGGYACYTIKIREDERGRFYYDPETGERREAKPCPNAADLPAALTACNPIPSPWDQKIDGQVQA